MGRELYGEDKKLFPSYYDLTKDFRIFEGCKLIQDGDIVDINQGLSSDDNAIEDMNENDDLQEEILTNTLRQEEEVEKKPKNYMAKIVGGFKACTTTMMKIHKKRYDSNLCNKNIGMLNSFDGANHLHTENGKTPIISCNAQLFSRQALDMGLFAASKDIFTHTQAMGNEDFGTMKPIVEEHYQQRDKVIDAINKEEGCTLRCYDVHDGKMLYLLSQHSSYNRKHKPMLMCNCERGACFRRKRHTCRKFTDDEIIRLYDNSKQRYDLMRQENQDYNVKNHAQWCDISNCGVTHFGLNPRIFKYSRIRYDTFHMICQVSRRMMNYLRRFINTQMYSIKDEFFVMLKQIMGRYNTSIWSNNKPFSSYDGKDIRLFIDGISKITEWLEKEFISSIHNTAVIKSLRLWKKISEFLRRCKIYDVKDGHIMKNKKIQEYKQDMKNYKDWVKEFYELGGTTFLKNICQEI